MRVISQDGMIDIPYNKCIVLATPCRADKTAFIKFTIDRRFIEIGHYSSLEVAKAVLEDMRLSYANDREIYMLPAEGMVQNEI